MDVQLPQTIHVTTHHQYRTAEHLTPSGVLASPFDEFKAWFQFAQTTKVAEPEAMSLSTASRKGIPSSRMVLLKEVDDRGFVFFTNYQSRKSKEIAENPVAALTFYWREVHRQIRVVGRVEKLEREESLRYYKSRPLGSRLGAWASPQSEVIGEGELQERLEDVKKKFGIKGEEGEEIAMPEHWGGWRVIPLEIEFWLGKPSRLHDRVTYIREDDGGEWTVQRVAP